MRSAIALSCLVAVACSRETAERPPPASAPTTRPRAALPLPETAFRGDEMDAGGARAAAAPSEERFTTKQIGPGERPRESAGGFAGARIDLDVKSADVHDVLRLIADVGKVNIAVAGDVTGTITLKLKGVPWDQALDVVLRAKGLSMDRDREGNVIVVHGR